MYDYYCNRGNDIDNNDADDIYGGCRDCNDDTTINLLIVLMRILVMIKKMVMV